MEKLKFYGKQKKKKVLFKVVLIRLSAGFSAEALQARRESHNICEKNRKKRVWKKKENLAI